MPRKIAILDTNILDYGFKAEYAASVNALLTELSKEYDLITTQYSRFELFRGLVSSRVPAAKSLFDTFDCVEINGDVFKIAAALTTCYKNDESTKSRASSFGDGDTIIGAAAFVHGTAILTSNLNDFPRPYFLDDSRTLPMIHSSKKEKTIAVGILNPDTRYLNTNIKLHYPPATEDTE